MPFVITQLLRAAASLAAVSLTMSLPVNAQLAEAISEQDAYEIARDAYIYAYPLVLMDLTRQQITNFVEPPGTPGQGPANRFIHVSEFPDPKFKIVIRPNADTLYSSAWLDLKSEPVVLSVPATQRYFLLPMLSMWSDVFAVPGTRTTGPNRARTFLVVGPGWSGNAPSDMGMIKSPTRYVWFAANQREHWGQYWGRKTPDEINAAISMDYDGCLAPRGAP